MHWELRVTRDLEMVRVSAAGLEDLGVGRVFIDKCTILVRKVGCGPIQP